MPSGKELVVAILAVVVHIGVLWLWNREIPLLAAGEFRQYGGVIIPLAGLMLSAALFAFLGAFVRTRWFGYASALAAITVPYFFTSSGAVAIGVLLASLLFAGSAIHRIQREVYFSISFHVSKVLRAGVPLYFTIISLTISMYYLAQIGQRNVLATIVPRSAFEVTFRTLAEPFASATGLSEIDPNSTVDEFLTQVVEKKLGDKGIKLSQVSSGELERLLTAERREVERQYGLELEGQKKVKDVFYTAVSARVEDFLGPYKEYLPYISVTTFFLAFKAITFPLYYLTLGFASVLIRLLISVNILRNEKQKIEVEQLTL